MRMRTRLCDLDPWNLSFAAFSLMYDKRVFTVHLLGKLAVALSAFLIVALLKVNAKEQNDSHNFPIFHFSTLRERMARGSHNRITMHMYTTFVSRAKQ